MSPSMLASTAGVFREEIRAPTKTPAGEATSMPNLWIFSPSNRCEMRGQKKRGGGVKGNSWSRKSLEKPLVFIVVSAENVGEITYSKSCRVGFATLPVANGYVWKIMLVSCYVITISKLLWLISFPINHLTSRFLQQIFTVKKFILKLMQKILL